MADEAGGDDVKSIRTSGNRGKLARDPLKDISAFRRFLKSTTNEKIVSLRDEVKRRWTRDLKRRGISEMAALEAGLGWYGSSKDSIRKALDAASNEEQRERRGPIRVNAIKELHDIAKRARRAIVPEEVDREPYRAKELVKYTRETRLVEGSLVHVVEQRMTDAVEALQTEEARRAIRDDEAVWIDIVTYCSAVTRDASALTTLKQKYDPENITVREEVRSFVRSVHEIRNGPPQRNEETGQAIIARNRVLRTKAGRHLGAVSCLLAFQRCEKTLEVGAAIASLVYARAAAFVGEHLWELMVQRWSRDNVPSTRRRGEQSQQDKYESIVLQTCSALYREGYLLSKYPQLPYARRRQMIEDARQRDVNGVLETLRQHLQGRDDADALVHEARMAIEMEREGLLSSFNALLKPHRGLSLKLDGTFFPRTALTVAKNRTFAASQDNALAHCHKRLRAHVERELLSLTLRDEPHRLESWRDLLGNDEDAFEVVSETAEEAVEFFRNAAARNDLINYAIDFVTTAQEDEDMAEYREVTLRGMLSEQLYDDVLIAINRVGEVWWEAHVYRAARGHPSTCRAELFSATDAAREVIKEVDGMVEAEYPRPARRNFYLHHELTSAVELFARRALESSGVLTETSWRSQASRKWRLAFIIGAKVMATQYIENGLRFEQDPVTQWEMAVRGNGVESVLQMAPEGQRATLERGIRRFEASQFGDGGEDANEAMVANFFARVTEFFGADITKFCRMWQSLRQQDPLPRLRDERRAEFASYEAKWLDIAKAYSASNWAKANFVPRRLPMRVIRQPDIWNAEKFKGKCVSFCAPRPGNFARFTQSGFDDLFSANVAPRQGGASNFFRPEGRPTGPEGNRNPERVAFVQNMIQTYIKTMLNVPRAPKGYVFTNALDIGPGGAKSFAYTPAPAEQRPLVLPVAAPLAPEPLPAPPAPKALVQAPPGQQLTRVIAVVLGDPGRRVTLTAVAFIYGLNARGEYVAPTDEAHAFMKCNINARELHERTTARRREERTRRRREPIHRALDRALRRMNAGGIARNGNVRLAERHAKARHYRALHMDRYSAVHGKSLTRGHVERTRAYTTKTAQFRAAIVAQASRAFPHANIPVEIVYGIGDGGLRSGSWAGSVIKGSPVTSTEKLVAHLLRGENTMTGLTTENAYIDEKWTSMYCAMCSTEHVSVPAPTAVCRQWYPREPYGGQSWRLKVCGLEGCPWFRQYKNRDTNGALSLAPRLVGQLRSELMDRVPGTGSVAAGFQRAFEARFNVDLNELKRRYDETFRAWRAKEPLPRFDWPPGPPGGGGGGGGGPGGGGGGGGGGGRPGPGPGGGGRGGGRRPGGGGRDGRRRGPGGGPGGGGGGPGGGPGGDGGPGGGPQTLQQLDGAARALGTATSEVTSELQNFSISPSAVRAASDQPPVPTTPTPTPTTSRPARGASTSAESSPRTPPQSSNNDNGEASRGQVRPRGERTPPTPGMQSPGALRQRRGADDDCDDADDDDNALPRR
jgi:hypothetical protein